MKTRNFIGAAVIALTSMLSPAPSQSAVVESAVAPLGTKKCALIKAGPLGGNANPVFLTIPVVAQELLFALGIIA